MKAQRKLIILHWIAIDHIGILYKYWNTLFDTASLCRPLFSTVLVVDAGIAPRDDIFKELIPPAYVARRAGTTTLFLHGS
jgi:hypothetical protein